ncbi:MAG: TIGR02281 family clan AA aspartic protease [Elainella sp.]
MTRLPRPITFTLFTGLLVWGSTACSGSGDFASSSSDLATGSTTASVTTASGGQNQPAASHSGSQTQAISQATASQTKSAVDPFQRAMERATSASTMSQSAQSRDDWRLVANRWQQAIQLMQAVPSTSPHRGQAAQKLAEYQRNLSYAQRQANRSTAPANPDGVIVLSPGLLPQKSPRPVPSPLPVAAAPQKLPAAQAPQAAPARPASPTAAQPSQGSFSVPIVRRAGNTPVVRVTFNANQSFDMIVDTGASGTLITRQMASALNVVPVAQASVDTASQKNVTFPLGYVQSVEVGGIVANNLLVAVAENQLDIGLLGHDFFGNYDVTIRQNSVEFRER